MMHAIYCWQSTSEGILKGLLHEAGKTAPTKKEGDKRINSCQRSCLNCSLNKTNIVSLKTHMAGEGAAPKSG